MAILTPEFRVSWPKVFTPELNTLNKKMEYSVVALFPYGKDDPKLAELKKLCKEALIKALGADESKWPKILKSPFRDQAEKAKNVDGKDVLPAGYVAGNIFVTLRSVQKPGLVDAQKNDIIDASEFYAGCWARASVSIYYYDKKGNKGVGIGLTNLQKTRDGDPLGGRTRAEDDFSPVAAEGGSSSGGGGAASLFD